MFDEFDPDPGTGVLVRASDERPVTYLDGAEDSLAALFERCGDLSSGSDELLALASSWPLRYHVSPHRWALLDALGLPGRASRLLELGAGCGAVTRWVGENFAEVHAVEGSLARAALARRRCRELENVRVYTANFSALRPAPRFDVVTMIGVLEYSPMFHSDWGVTPESAVESNLRFAHASLAEPGAMIVAIENRLGTKYLLGAPEDHTGRAWEGVEGYPRHRTPITFSPSRLEELIRSAGFDDVRLLTAWPDYKFARTLVNPQRAAPADRLHNWIAGGPARTGPRRGPSNALVLRELVRAGLAEQLANSLVAIGLKGSPEQVVGDLHLDLDWAIRHYAMHRRRVFRKRLTLRGETDSRTLAVERPEEHAAPVAQHGGLRQDLRAEDLRDGDLLVFDVLASLAADGPVPALSRHTAEFRRWLLDRHRTGDGSFVHGHALDLTWWNVVVDPTTAEWLEIDREWQVQAPLPADFVVWRMLRHFATHFAESLPPGLPPKPAVFATVVLATVPESRPDLAREFYELDQAIGRVVAPGTAGAIDEAARALSVAAATPCSSAVSAPLRLAGGLAMSIARLRWLARRGGQAARHRATTRRSVRRRPQ